MRALLRTVDGCERQMMVQGQPLRIRLPICELPLMASWAEGSVPEPVKITHREYRFDHFMYADGGEIALYIEDLPRTPRPTPDETAKVLADLFR